MKRYIDADKLCLDIMDINDESIRSLFNAFVRCQPTAEVIEVSQIEHDVELLRADAEGFKNSIQKDLDKGEEPNQLMLIQLHTAVTSYSALECLVDRYRRSEE